MKAGQSQAEVARWLAVTRNVVSRLWKKFKTTANVTRTPGQGRPRVTTLNQDRYLSLLVHRNRRMTASQLRSDLNAATGVLVSTDTIRRRLHKKGLYARRPIICVPLTPPQKRARKLWCRQHVAWNPDEWRRVMFTDESRFSLNSDSRRVFVWREPRRKIRAHYEHMSEFETGRTIGLKKAGWSNRLIARHLCRSDAAIKRFWQKWVNNGSMQRQDGSGRPRATTERRTEQLSEWLSHSTGIHVIYHPTCDRGTQVSKMTINRRLRERNLRARRPLRCPPLTPVHRQVRLQWCRERSTWNCADWERIVFSDESRFLLGPSQRRHARISRTSHRGYHHHPNRQLLRHQDLPPSARTSRQDPSKNPRYAPLTNNEEVPWQPPQKVITKPHRSPRHKTRQRHHLSVIEILFLCQKTRVIRRRRKRRQFKQTDAFTKGMVIGLKRAGWSIRQIAADTHLGASTVHRLWRRWLEQGNVAIYRNVGATRVTSARVDRRILRQAVAAPKATCSAFLQHVQGTLDQSISTRTISRRLVANGLHSCRPLRRLPLTPPNRRQRLEWCRARSTWMTEWHRVVFSDESRFCLSSDSRRVRVWRRRGERSNPAAIVECPTVRQLGIMGVPNALYQQDNARPHTARISQQALQDVQMLPWPPYSPELSPIEHVWDIIGRRLHALPQPRSEDERWQMVEREWRAIPQDAIRTLIDSLPRRVAACIAVR
ncbi:Transposase, partial [Cordylochernes scorpioides]